MGKKGHSKESKKKLTKKEKKQQNHLKLVHGNKTGNASSAGDWNQQDKKKSA